MHTRVALVLIGVALRVALFTADDVHPPADAYASAQFCPPLCRLLGWGAARTYAALTPPQAYDREGTCWPPAVLVPVRALALAGDALFAFAANEFCFVAYAHNQRRRDLVFGVLFNAPLLLAAGHLQLRPHCAVLAALVLLAMTNFWRGNIYRAWALHGIAVALDASLAYLAPVFFVFFVRCVAASSPPRRSLLSFWRPALFLALSAAAALAEAANMSRRWLSAEHASLALLLRSAASSIRPAQVLAAIVYILLQIVCCFSPLLSSHTFLLCISPSFNSQHCVRSGNGARQSCSPSPWCRRRSFGARASRSGGHQSSISSSLACALGLLPFLSLTTTTTCKHIHASLFFFCNSAMCGINRHAGRLSVLTSLFCSTVMLSRFSWTDNAQWPYLPFLFFYAFAHWMFHMATHVAMNITCPQQSVVFFPKRFVSFV